MTLAQTISKLCRAGGVFVLTFVACTLVPAQEAQPTPALNAPPPLRIISPEERALLGQIKDTKGRVRKSMEFAEVHLLKAETHTTQEQFIEASAELGRYWALIEDVLHLMSPLDNDKNKTRDLYKRVELALRAHAPRLTLMRRKTPLEYGVWIKTIEDFTRSSRTEALNSFYGHTVVREGQNRPGEKTNDKPARENLAPASKQP
jgi:hypothetical protein